MEAGSSGGINPKDNERSNSKNNCKFTKNRGFVRFLSRCAAELSPIREKRAVF